MAKKPKAKKSTQRSPMTLATAGVGVLAVIAWLGWAVPWLCLFVVAGMLPTLAAAVTDTSKEKHDAIAVGTLSAGAMLPFLLDGLAQAGRSGGREILGNPFAWFSVYAAAVFAYALCWIFPIVVNVIYENRAEARLRQLLRRQQNLVAEWGESVREETPGQGGG
jgi:asparagine N-glycosylation enzyme membrane subunit Stt3